MTSEGTAPVAETALWVRLAELAYTGQDAALQQLVADVEEADLVHALAHLASEERGAVLAHLDAEQAADLMSALPEAYAAEAIGEIEPAAAADILEELESDEQADLIGQLERDDAEAILAEADADTVESVRALLQYLPESAGGRMITEFVAFRETDTVQQVVDRLRAGSDIYEDFAIQYVYALGARGELRGVAPLRSLLLAQGERPLASVAVPKPISVEATTSLDDVFEMFDHHDYMGLPVVDEEKRLVGVLLREDVDEARVDRAEASELAARGIVGGEELRSMSLWRRSSRRLSWLSINIVLNVIAASVIAFYQDTLEAVIALAVFLPIISDMSGCSGNQAVAVSLRELSLGVTRPAEVLRVWTQEVSVGLVNGIALGALLAGVAYLWQGNVALGLVVGAALALNTLVAVSIGGTVPLLIRRLGFDPALASGPVLTTVTDMCGFFLVLSLASVALARITG